MAVKTEIGYTTPDAITVRGKNLSTEIIGRFDFVDMIYWVTFGRKPEPREKNMVNMMLVTAADHGLTPSALSARLTYLGAPESIQGAVAAGLLGAGSKFLGTIQNVTEMLMQEAAALHDDDADDVFYEHAKAMLRRFKEEKRIITGIGHPIHVDGDPRVPTLRQISEENGYFGKHWRLALAIPLVFKKEYGKVLPLNGAGGLGAVMADMNLDPMLGRGLILIGRSAGLVAHVMEERDSPTGQQVWDLVLTQDPRNVAPEKKQ
jgi:citrate synthase